MLTINPFAELSATISPSVMQMYIIVMVILVVGGTLLDMAHKKSATYFFNNMKKAKEKGTEVSGGEKVSIAVQTVAVDVLTSGEFCNQKRRVSHLLTMYGFSIYALTTAIMVFGYPTLTAATPTILPTLWTIGALMVCVGGYWFWFSIRVDVAAEGNTPLRIVRADMFVLTLLASCTLALLWAYSQAAGSDWSQILLGLYLLATTALFGTVTWSKFSHMFFKPAAAFEKRLSKANGTRSNLPAPADRTDPADRDRHSMELLKDAPMDMGLGIKREAPRHY
jgi:hypothetical protein